MAKRFFKLLYTIALIGIALFLPIYILNSIEFDKIVLSSYKAKCISNNEYVILQGDDKPTIWNEIYLESDNKEAIEKRLNFYCKYHDEIQPHILSYVRARNTNEQIIANQEFIKFEQNLPEVYSYPKLYTLDLESEERQLYKIYGPIIDGVSMALGLFILLQALRMAYVYIVFGKVVWHPFRKISE